MEAEMFDDEKNMDGDALVRNLKNIFADAKQMLQEKAEEFGIDVTPISDEEFAVIRERERSFVESDELIKIAEKYASDSAPVLEAKDSWLSDSADDPMVE